MVCLLVLRVCLDVDGVRDDKSTAREILAHILELVDAHPAESGPEVGNIERFSELATKPAERFIEMLGILSDHDLRKLCDYIGGSIESMEAFIRKRNTP